MADDKKPQSTRRAPLVTTADQYKKVNAGQGGSETSKNIKKADEAVARLKGKENG